MTVQRAKRGQILFCEAQGPRRKRKGDRKGDGPKSSEKDSEKGTDLFYEVRGSGFVGLLGVLK